MRTGDRDAEQLLPLAESDLQRLVICDRANALDCLPSSSACMAHALGWHGVHFRPARTRHGWRVPVSGDMGKGWPDLVLVHPRRGRVIVAELKSDGGRVEAEQLGVLELFANVPGVLAVIWRPRDLDSGAILAELQR